MAPHVVHTGHIDRKKFEHRFGLRSRLMIKSRDGTMILVLCQDVNGDSLEIYVEKTEDQLSSTRTSFLAILTTVILPTCVKGQISMVLEIAQNPSRRIKMCTVGGSWCKSERNEGPITYDFHFGALIPFDVIIGLNHVPVDIKDPSPVSYQVKKFYNNMIQTGKVQYYPIKNTSWVEPGLRDVPEVVTADTSFDKVVADTIKFKNTMGETAKENYKREVDRRNAICADWVYREQAFPNYFLTTMDYSLEYEIKAFTSFDEVKRWFAPLINIQFPTTKELKKRWKAIPMVDRPKPPPLCAFVMNFMDRKRQNEVKQMNDHRRKRFREIEFPSSEDESMIEDNNEPVAGPSNEPQPGPSNEPMNVQEEIITIESSNESMNEKLKVMDVKPADEQIVSPDANEVPNWTGGVSKENDRIKVKELAEQLAINANDFGAPAIKFGTSKCVAIDEVLVSTTTSGHKERAMDRTYNIGTGRMVDENSDPNLPTQSSDNVADPLSPQGAMVDNDDEAYQRQQQQTLEAEENGRVADFRRVMDTVRTHMLAHPLDGAEVRRRFEWVVMTQRANFPDVQIEVLSAMEIFVRYGLKFVDNEAIAGNSRVIHEFRRRAAYIGSNKFAVLDSFTLNNYAISFRHSDFMFIKSKRTFFPQVRKHTADYIYGYLVARWAHVKERRILQ